MPYLLSLDNFYPKFDKSNKIQTKYKNEDIEGFYLNRYDFEYAEFKPVGKSEYYFEISEPNSYSQGIGKDLDMDNNNFSTVNISFEFKINTDNIGIEIIDISMNPNQKMIIEYGGFSINAFNNFGYNIYNKMHSVPEVLYNDDTYNIEDNIIMDMFYNINTTNQVVKTEINQ